MPYGLVMGTEKANALQKSIQLELVKRGFSEDEDPVMSEYINIMVINNKTNDQINTELEDLIGADFDRSFTDWLFAEAARSVEASEPEPDVVVREAPPLQAGASEGARRPSAPRSSFQQAISQAIPSSSTGQKRSASARSPSPSPGDQPPNKTRRTEGPPRGPRAMTNGAGPNNRSLLDRMGGPNQRFRSNHDEVQSRIDNITNVQGPGAMMPGMNGGMGMDMAMMNGGMGMGGAPNQMMLQEMMMNQMALMAQMANSMGMLGPNGAIPPGPFPGQNGMFDPMQVQNGFPQGHGAMDGQFSGRGRGRGRGRGGMRGGEPRNPPANPSAASADAPTAPAVAAASPATLVAPTAIPAVAAVPTGPVLFNLPERPQSPSLCKFGLKCTNAHCRYSHPSPVATPESGVVLSNEVCENGKNCKDKDCVKGHVSPAVVNGNAVEQKPIRHPPPHHAPSAPIPCRYGAGCTKQNTGCPFSHPKSSFAPHALVGAATTPCRFGTACTRATCPYQHPEGRVLPSTFHRGLAPTGGLSSVHAPATGTLGGGGSQHRTVVFNNPATKGKADKKEDEEEKEEVEAVIGVNEAAPVEIGA